MRRYGFALLELVIVLGIMSAVTSLSIPAYREYQVRSDLDKTTQQVTQGLARARLLATSGERDSAWGFHVPSGTLYKGETYEGRDTGFDEVFPMPSTIAVNGLLDVAYSRVRATPNEVGTITLRALNDELRTVEVTIAVSEQSLATNQTDVLTVCHHNSTTPGDTETIIIPDATWPYHSAHGDVVGACVASSASSSSVTSSSSSVATTSSSSSVAPSSSSSSVASSSSSSSSAGTCAKFTMAANQTITLTAASTVTFTNLLSQITFGQGGPQVPVHVCYSKSSSPSFNTLFGGNGNCSGNGNAYGNAVQPTGTDTKNVNLVSGNVLAVKVHGKYTRNGWLAFEQAYLSNDATGHVILLRNGSTLGNYSGFGSQTPLRNYLVNHAMANASGVVTIGACEVLAITELGTLNSSGADFQDDVMLMSFN